MKKTIARVKNFICPDWVYMLLLVVYSMRFVGWGVDMWDAGYSYANFQYMGYEHMDSMWLFSTFLANAVGHFLTKLPFANTLLGMNVYTTLFISALAITGYLFYTKTLKVPKWITFLGELIALSVCWCPSAVLYNYMSYLLVAVCVVLLYKGITKEKQWFLFAAGICLGANVLTRFSNLPQMALIVGVWAYGVLTAIETKEKGAFAQTLRRTLWCLGGYLTGLLSLMSYIHIKYGLDAYVQGIIRLFSMTETEKDYTPITMVLSLLYSYYINLFWVAKMLVVMLIGIVIWVIAEKLNKQKIAIILNVALVAGMICKLYIDGFCSLNFYAYDSIRDPSTVFMFLAMLIAFIKFIRKDIAKDEKLVGVLVVLVLFISSIGSNNGIYSGMNNLFLVAPYVLWNGYQLLKNKRCLFPIKAVLTGFLLFYFCQNMLFGTTFYYAEARGEQNITATVENNKVLAGIKMNPEKAEILTGLYDYVVKNDLQDRETIVLGQIPSLAYYLQMPPAFNAWIDLGSYSKSQFELDLGTLQQQMDAGEVKPPVIIVSDAYENYEPYRSYQDSPKWDVLTEFMEENGYFKTFVKGEYTVYEAD